MGVEFANEDHRPEERLLKWEEPEQVEKPGENSLLRLEKGLASSFCPSLTTSSFLYQKKVLLVDDNRVNQLVTSKMLEKWGLQVEIAGDGKEGVKKAAEKDFDIILMDLQMPGMDGFEATRQIRSLSSHNGKVPVMALTASAILSLQPEIQNCNINDCLMKPFKPEDLYNLIYKSLCKKEQDQPVNPLQEKVDGIVKGDTEFKKQLLLLYQQSFREILDDLKKGQLKDAVYLRGLRHKHKPSLKMLGLAALECSLEQLQQALEAPPEDGFAVEQHYSAIQLHGEQVLVYLEAVV
ncbi:response regulator [Nafulsella turpanensis]|uniref:response regulator n=1 Tax=Nafulsella turpanensis TaxID=1265690 RepID=UPI0003458214|nr:response regulator [Nafulsella turpanensis]